jgi:hypothetical protein
MSRWSDQKHVRDRSPQFLLDTNTDPHCCTQHAATTFSHAEAALIYFHKFAKLPSSLPPHNPKKLYGKPQMNTNIALRQNCDQSATIWWSRQGSAWHWWVREWHLTLNESTDNGRKPTLGVVYISRVSGKEAGTKKHVQLDQCKQFGRVNSQVTGEYESSRVVERKG